MIARDSDPDACLIMADPIRLRHTLYNLLSNAVKFTPPGEEISVTTVHDESSVQVIVADTGIVMPPDGHCDIFLA